MLLCFKELEWEKEDGIHKLLIWPFKKRLRIQILHDQTECNCPGWNPVYTTIIYSIF